MSNPIIILLNGPPRSGKDTLSDSMWQWNPMVHQEKFARPLKETVPVIYGIDRNQWVNNYDTPTSKDTPFPVFLGKTPRQVQIALSESFFKPLHGKGVFGGMLAARVRRVPEPAGTRRIVVVSDSGFRTEAEEVVAAFGASNTFLIRIHRHGTTFDGDSRGYIGLADMGVREIDFHNSKGIDSIARFGRRVLDCVSKPQLSIARDGREPETDSEYYDRVSKLWDMVLTSWADEERLLELERANAEAAF